MTTKKIGLIALLASFAVEGAMAQTFTNYQTGDVLVGFRKSLDLVVDAGNISTYTGLGINQSSNVTAFSGSDLAAIGGTNLLYWSAFTYQNNGTIYATRPRSSGALNSEAQPWTGNGSTLATLTINWIKKIVTGAQAYYNNAVYSSTPTSVVEDTSSSGNPYFGNGVSLQEGLDGNTSSLGTFEGTFAGNIEQQTGIHFTTGNTVERADFFQVPANGSSVWLGYFELNTNGALKYVAYPITTPAITSITRSGNTTTIQYTTGYYGTYTLRSSSSLPASSWSSVTTLTSGDTLTHTYVDTTSDDSRFYTITAQ